MEEKKIKAGKVFFETIENHKNGKRLIIWKGGTEAGKTFELVMCILFYFNNLIKNETFTCVAETLQSLKGGVRKDMINILNQSGISYKSYESFSNYVIKLIDTGNTIEFTGADRLGQKMGNRRFLLYANEMNFVNKEIWLEMMRRSDVNLCDFNPFKQFWLEEILEIIPDWIVLKTNYLHNIAPNPEAVKKIELRLLKDPNFKRIHIDCEYGSSEGLVFKPEQIILIDEFPSDVHYTYGLDFGYVAPSCLVKVADYGDNIYIDEMFYRSGMNTFDLINEVKKHNDSRIYADSEDRRMINELLANGVNVYQAKKRAGSVEAGISYLQSKTIYITKRSINTIKEFRELIHEVNRHGQFTGNFLGDDHAIDGTRYSVEDRSSSVGIRSQQAGESMHQTYHEKYGNK